MDTRRSAHFLCLCRLFLLYRPQRQIGHPRFLGKRLGITVFQPRLKVRTFARTNYYEYGKQRQVQESP